MKKRCIAVLLVWVLLVCVLLPYRVKSYALGDPITADIISGTLYSMMSSWGIAFSTTGATSAGTEGIFNQLVNDYCDYKGGNLADIFYGQILVDAAGKLAVSYQIYNTAIDFVNWMKNRFTGNGITLGEYSDGYIFAGTNEGDSELPGGYRIYFSEVHSFDWGFGYDRVFYSNGRESGTVAQGTNYYTYKPVWQYASIDRSNNRILITLHSVLKSNGSRYSDPLGAVPLGDATLTNMMDWDNSSYSDPSEITQYYSWEGNIDGVSEPGISLQDLIDSVFDAVKDNLLVVSGELVEVSPEPTPVPTYPPGETILDAVNTQIEQLNDLGQDIGGMREGIEDLNDLSAQQLQVLEEMGIDIGGLTQGIEDLNDLSAQQLQVLEDMGIDIGGLSENIEDMVDIIIVQNDKLDVIDQSIADNAGVVSGAIDQAVSDIQTAIGEQTAALDETLTNTAENVQDIADVLQPGEIETKQFDLRRLFPFCIPFDIHNLLQKFNAEPVAPHVQLPFVIQSIGFSYMFDLNFSAFDSVAAAMRTVEFIVFAIGLAWATSKVIKW